MQIQLALQLYTVRTPLAENFARTCKQIAEIGYRYVELAGLHGHSVQAATQMLADAGLSAIAAHESFESLDTDLPGVIERARVFGYQYITLPWLEEHQRTAEGFLAAAKLLEHCESHPDAQGLTFGYHHHAFEFDKLEDDPHGRRGFDIILAQPSPSCEIDTYWITAGGDDPIVWLDRLTGRVPVIHLKDMAPAAQGETLGKIIELGRGTLDFSGILTAARAAGTQYACVEQDEDWIDGDPLKSIKISYDYIAGLM